MHHLMAPVITLTFLKPITVAMTPSQPCISIHTVHLKFTIKNPTDHPSNRTRTALNHIKLTELPNTVRQKLEKKLVKRIQISWKTNWHFNGKAIRDPWTWQMTTNPNNNVSREKNIHCAILLRANELNIHIQTTFLKLKAPIFLNGTQKRIKI